MSPAEITQQLGLQSLTRRAWVSDILDACDAYRVTNDRSSSSNLPAPPLVMVCTRVWSGLPMRSGKPTAIKVYNANANRTCSWMENTGNLQMMDWWWRWRGVLWPHMTLISARKGVLQLVRYFFWCSLFKRLFFLYAMLLASFVFSSLRRRHSKITSLPWNPPEICISTQNCKISESQIGQGEKERTRKGQMSRNFEISICFPSAFLFWLL